MLYARPWARLLGVEDAVPRGRSPRLAVLPAAWLSAWIQPEPPVRAVVQGLPGGVGEDGVQLAGDLGPARAPLRPGPALRHRNARGAFWTVNILESGGLRGPRHFDFKPPRTEDLDGVWASAPGFMRNYPILRSKARAVRDRPRGRAGAG